MIAGMKKPDTPSIGLALGGATLVLTVAYFAAYLSLVGPESAGSLSGFFVARIYFPNNLSFSFSSRLTSAEKDILLDHQTCD